MSCDPLPLGSLGSLPFRGHLLGASSFACAAAAEILTAEIACDRLPFALLGRTDSPDQEERGPFP